jgi:hypothetical protein
MNTVINLAGAETLTCTIQNLAPATYYFAVTAVDPRGLESAQSNTVTRIVR